MIPGSRSQAVTKDVTPLAGLASLAPVIEWLAEIFLAPMDGETMQRMRSAHARTQVAGIGEMLNCPTDTARMNSALSQTAALDMAAGYVSLFDGVRGRRTVSLYESYYCSDGTRLFQAPVNEMNTILRDLDLSVRDGCAEPADHLSIELVALAAALRQGEWDIAFALHDRLMRWAPRLHDRLRDEDPGGYYSSAAAVIACLLAEIGTAKHSFCQ